MFACEAAETQELDVCGGLAQEDSSLMTRRVFISHTSADAEAARQVAQTLKRTGIDVLLAEDDVQIGENVLEAIRRQLESADAYIVIVGARALRSNWFRRELSEIVKQTWADERKIVVPVILEDGAVPGAFADCQSIRFTDDQPLRHALNRCLVDEAVPGMPRTLRGAGRLAHRLSQVESVAADLAEPEPGE